MPNLCCKLLQEQDDLMTVSLLLSPPESGYISLLDSGRITDGNVAWEIDDSDGATGATSLKFSAPSHNVNTMLNRVLFKGNSYSGSATIVIMVEDAQGATSSESIILSMTGSNTPPSIEISKQQEEEEEVVTMEEDGFLSFDSSGILITVDDVDVGDTPGGFLEVSVSSSDYGTLEVQRITTSIDHYYPVWLVESSASGGET